MCHLVLDSTYKECHGLSPSDKESAYNAGDMVQEDHVGWEDPLEKEWLPTPAFFLGGSHGQRSPAGYSPWGLKESNMTEVTEPAHMRDVIGYFSFAACLISLCRTLSRCIHDVADGIISFILMAE